MLLYTILPKTTHEGELVKSQCKCKRMNEIESNSMTWAMGNSTPITGGNQTDEAQP